MSQYHVLFLTDAKGNTVDTTWYHHGCIPSGIEHDTTAWPAPGDTIDGEYCGGCGMPLMLYKVEGTASDGVTFWADGSDDGKQFASSAAAVAYAEEYGKCVGTVSFPGSLSGAAGWILRTTKPDGYYEDLRLVVVP